MAYFLNNSRKVGEEQNSSKKAQVYRKYIRLVPPRVPLSQVETIFYLSKPTAITDRGDRIRTCDLVLPKH